MEKPTNGHSNQSWQASFAWLQLHYGNPNQNEDVLNENTTALCPTKPVVSAAILARFFFAVFSINWLNKLEFLNFLHMPTTTTKAVLPQTCGETIYPILCPPLHSYITHNKVCECRLLTAFSRGKPCKVHVMNLIWRMHQMFTTFTCLEPALSTLNIRLITVTRIIRHTIIIFVCT